MTCKNQAVTACCRPLATWCVLTSQLFLLGSFSTIASLGILGHEASWAQSPLEMTNDEIPTPNVSAEAAPTWDSTPSIELSSPEAPPEVPREAPAASSDLPTVTVPPTPIPEAQAPAAVAPPQENAPYMDATPYDLGATPYEAPDTVIFSDRSSGCQVVLSGDQGLNSNPCAAGSDPTTTADNSASEAWGSSVSGTASAEVSSGRSNGRSLGWNASGLIPSYMGRYQSFLKRSGKGEINLLFPLSIPAAITSAFGWRIHPITGDQRFHAGTDLGAPSGTPVLAADAGQVSVAEVMGGYGLTVILSHKQDTVQTLYAHLSEILVQPGDRVKQGAVIGRVGSTGNSTGPHLHFEMQKFTPEGWIAVDPGIQLETAVAQLIKYLQTAQVKSTRTVS